MNQEGIGLGLVISKKIVEMLGPQDKIDIFSVEGKGSQFSF